MRLRRNAAGPRIEMLPLMDMVFLLLVVFMYAMLSMAVHHGLPVTLPASSTAEIEKNVALALTISASGEVFLDKEPVAVEALSSILAARKAASDDPEGISIRVFADKSVAYQAVYTVLDSVRAAGITRVSLQGEMENMR
jgi:biopolymer transport protein ExbD